MSGIFFVKKTDEPLDRLRERVSIGNTKRGSRIFCHFGNLKAKMEKAFQRAILAAEMNQIRAEHEELKGKRGPPGGEGGPGGPGEGTGAGRAGAQPNCSHGY